MSDSRYITTDPASRLSERFKERKPEETFYLTGIGAIHLVPAPLIESAVYNPFASGPTVTLTVWSEPYADDPETGMAEITVEPGSAISWRTVVES